MNFLIKIIAVIVIITLVYKSSNKLDQTLLPPDNARHVTVLFRMPDDITLMPMQVLYRSEKCMAKSYNSSFESYPVRGYNGFTQPFVRQGQSDLWQTAIAIDGGGRCQWQLNSLRVSFTLAENHPLAKGKVVIETSYIFDFDKYGLSDGYGTGKAKTVSGDLDIKTDFFPIITHHIDNGIDLSLFGGDTGYEQWRRRYKTVDSQSINIEPKIHFDNVVTLTPPAVRPGNLNATYPDGSSEQIPHIYPDYEKLLSMK